MREVGYQGRVNAGSGLIGQGRRWERQGLKIKRVQREYNGRGSGQILECRAPRNG